MTSKHYTKALKQLKVKPVKMRKYLKHSAKKKKGCGVGQRRCVRCGRFDGHVSKYGLHLCRHCFRDIATQIGFKKYN